MKLIVLAAFLFSFHISTAQQVEELVQKILQLQWPALSPFIKIEVFTS